MGKKLGVLIKNRVVVAVALLMAVIMTIMLSNSLKKEENKTAELDEAQKLLATRETNGNQAGEDIYFNAFFLKDSDEDGYAEEYAEIDQQIGTQNFLYMELIFNTQGYLDNPEITIDGKNFKLNTALASNNVIDGDYVGEVDTIRLKKLTNGTQVLLYGTTISDIGNNINNYSNESAVVLTGTYIDEDGNETPIRRESKVTINWYGITKTKIKNALWQNYNIENCVKGDYFVANFYVWLAESEEKLHVCKHCLRKLNQQGYNFIYENFSIEEFFKVMNEDNSINFLYLPDENDLTAPTNIYPDNWKEISRRLKEKYNYTCQECHRNFSNCKSQL